MENSVNPLRHHHSLEVSSKIIQSNPTQVTMHGIGTQKDLFIDRDAAAFSPQKTIKQVLKDILARIFSLLAKAASILKKSPSQHAEENIVDPQDTNPNERADNEQNEMGEGVNQNPINRGNETALESGHLGDDNIGSREEILEANKRKFEQIPDSFKDRILQRVKEKSDEEGGDTTIPQLYQHIMEYRYPTENQELDGDERDWHALANHWVNLSNPQSVINQEIQSFLDSIKDGLALLEQAIHDNDLDSLIEQFDALDSMIQREMYRLVTQHYTGCFEDITEQRIAEIEEAIRIQGPSASEGILLNHQTSNGPIQKRYDLFHIITPKTMEASLQHLKEKGQEKILKDSPFLQTLESGTSNHLITCENFMNLPPEIRNEVTKEIHKRAALEFAGELLSGEEEEIWAYHVIHRKEPSEADSISLHCGPHLLEKDSLFIKSFNKIKHPLDQVKTLFETDAEV